MSRERREPFNTRKGRSDMNRKAILAAVLAAAMLTGMTGCGGNTGSSTADSSAAADSTEPAAESGDSSEDLPESMPDDDFETVSAESSDSEAPQDTPAEAGAITFDYVLNGTDRKSTRLNSSHQD